MQIWKKLTKAALSKDADMKWLRQASNDYLTDRACELIKEGNVLKALKCLIVLEERKPDGSPKDTASPTT